MRARKLFSSDDSPKKHNFPNDDCPGRDVRHDKVDVVFINQKEVNTCRIEITFDRGKEGHEGYPMSCLVYVQDVLEILES